MIVKGVKISELELRDKLTGEEMIPFQDQLSNGKMDMKSIIDYFEEVSDQEVNLQSLVNIKQYVSNSKELEFISSNVGDVYFNTGDKKLYVYQEGGTWATTDPSKYRMYVRLDKDEYGRTNIIHRWDGNNMTVISERLFIGEEEGTAYEGSKGKQVRDDLDALNATIDKYPAKLVSGILDPNYSDSSVDLRYSFYDRISDTNSTGTKTVNCASQSNAGFMAASDKVKLDVTLPNDIKAEEDARKAADSTLQGNIDSSNSDLNSKITAETERATQAENTITTNYKTADSTLQSNINNEATARSEADAALDSKISKEVSDRTQAINTLQSNLDAEVARATDAEQDITNSYQSADTTLQNNINAINNSKGVANGIATLDQNGLVPSSQLPSYVDDVIEVNTFSALPNTGESGKIYITQDTNLTYRWSGTAYVEISQSLALGETSSTAYAGDKGKATTDKVNRLPNKMLTGTTGSSISDSSVVLNFSYYDQKAQSTGATQQTISSATTSKAGVMTAADKTKLNGLKDQAGITADIDAVQTNLETHINNKTNPHEVTKAQVGLGNVDNTADTDKPISTATQTALDAKFSLTEGNSLKTTADSLPNRIIAYIPGSSINATGETVGITEVTQYVDKSDGVYGSLKQSTVIKTLTAATTTKAGVLSAADKVKLDVTLPNDIKAEEDARKAADSTLQGNIDSSNSDLNSKITAETERATQAENTITTNYKTADSTLQSNINNEATARSEADAALDSKISKEVSDRTQAINTLQSNLDAEVARATDAEQDITNSYQSADTTLQNNINAINNSKGVANGIATLDQNGLVPSSQLPSYVDDVIEVNTFSALPNTGESGKIYITQDTNLTYRWSGTAYVEISQSLALGETSSTAYAGDKGKATTDKVNRLPNKMLTGTTGSSISDSSVVLNFSYYDQKAQSTGATQQTISSATTSKAGVMTAADKTKLNGLKDQAGITADIDAVQTNLETHINNKTNPHEVTKAQVGLGNVDNTADTDKPISTATQTALDAKFSLTEGNSLKTTADSLPNRIIAYIPGSSINATGETVGITEVTQYVDKSDGVYGSLKQSTVIKTLTAATTTKAGVLSAADKVKIDKITTDGDGTKYLADNGTYKLIQGGGSGDSGTFVLETAAVDQLTDTEYNDLKDAIEANKIIIADLGLTLGVIAQIYQPCFAATYDSGSNRIVLSLTQTTGTTSGSEDTRRLVVCDIIISGNTGHSVSRDNYNLVNENMVLTFGNTKEYTPTTVYSPATKKYVDDNRYGKTFVVSSVNSFLTNRKETGSAAETATNNIFGSKESFRAVVDDIISNHTRYYIHVDGDANNCVELGCVNAQKNADSSTYQLHFIITYYTGSTLYTKRISINSDSSADNAFIEIADLVNSDNINVMTKKTTSEYNSLSKNDNTAYFVVD